MAPLWLARPHRPQAGVKSQCGHRGHPPTLTGGVWLGAQMPSQDFVPFASASVLSDPKLKIYRELLN